MKIFARKSGRPPGNRRRDSAPPKRISRQKARNVLDKLGNFGRRAAEVGVFVAAIVGLVILGRWTHTYVTTSNHFGAGVAVVTGQHRVSSEEIQLMSGLAPGKNIFSVGPEEAARRVSEHPWIATAKVRRRLPSHVTIEVVEHEPVALLRVGGLYLVDTEGAVFKPLERGDPVDLPIITGVDQNRYREDRPGAHEDLREALSLLRLYEESGLSSRWPLSEVHLERDGTLSLYTLEESTHIRLGRPPFRRKLRRLARLMREFRDQRTVADYVYLQESDDHVQPDRAVVRLRAN